MGRQKQLIVPLKDFVVESFHVGGGAIRGAEVWDFPALAVHDAFGGMCL